MAIPPLVSSLFTRLLCTLLFVGGLVLPLGAQQEAAAAGAPAAAARKEQRTVLQGSMLRTFYFTPINADADQLCDTARRLYGRELWVAERGGLDGPPVTNLLRMGDTIIIYDTEEHARAIGEALHAIDGQLARPQRNDAVTVAEWKPRHIALESARQALGSFMRQTSVRDETGRYTDVQNISVLQDRGQLILRDTPDQVQQMLALLARLDVPETQALLTCMVVRGRRDMGGSDPGIPAELAQHLGQLVPFQEFELVTIGVLRTSTLARDVTLRMDDEYRLSLESDAYDAEAQTITARCAFQDGGNQSLETHTSLRAGEYTVLGAAGREPLFAVLKIELLAP